MCLDSSVEILRKGLTNRKVGYGWQRVFDLKRKMEALIYAAQEQSLQTITSNRVDNSDLNDKCRVCEVNGETAWHIINKKLRILALFPNSKN